jgi:hypothetical protein
MLVTYDILCTILFKIKAYLIEGMEEIDANELNSFK